MTFAGTLLPEFDQEMAATRRLLERVPAAKGPWKPNDVPLPPIYGPTADEGRL
jgi:hypothetical protein